MGPCLADSEAWTSILLHSLFYTFMFLPIHGVVLFQTVQVNGHVFQTLKIRSGYIRFLLCHDDVVSVTVAPCVSISPGQGDTPWHLAFASHLLRGQELT